MLPGPRRGAGVRYAPHSAPERDGQLEPHAPSSETAHSEGRPGMATRWRGWVWEQGAEGTVVKRTDRLLIGSSHRGQAGCSPAWPHLLIFPEKPEPLVLCKTKSLVFTTPTPTITSATDVWGPTQIKSDPRQVLGMSQIPSSCPSGILGYRHGPWGSERASDLPKVTQAGSTSSTA